MDWNFLKNHLKEKNGSGIKLQVFSFFLKGFEDYT